ncbi:Uncharacterised protein g9010 [Pycnogonum litorale]
MVLKAVIQSKELSQQTQSLFCDESKPELSRISKKYMNELYNAYVTKLGQTCYFHEFLEKFRFNLPKPHIPPRNPELEARIQKLKNKQASREYKEMTKNVDATVSTSEIAHIRSESKAIRNQLISMLNFSLSVAGSFAFVYKAVEYSLPEPNIPAQILLSMITATVVAMAELYFFITYEMK